VVLTSSFLTGIAAVLGCAAGGSAPRAEAAPPVRREMALPQGASLTRDPATGTVRFLKGPDLSIDLDADPAFKASRSAGDAEGVARAFLEHYAALWRLDDPRAELRQHKIQVDKSGASHVRFAQVWQGLPIPGAEIVVHLDRERRVKVVGGSYFESPRNVGTTPALDAEAARAAAARETGTEPCRDCTVELVVFADREVEPRLAWRVAPPKSRYQLDEVTVDAETGAILRRLPTSLSGGARRAE
jgi:hypothetical protein